MQLAGPLEQDGSQKATVCRPRRKLIFQLYSFTRLSWLGGNVLNMLFRVIY